MERRGPYSGGPDGTLVSLPSPATSASGEVSRTVEVHGLSAPAANVEGPDHSESGTQTLLRAFTPGVTLEHPDRYAFSDCEAKSELGRGGIGRVFVALDRHLEREVAIKELLPSVIEAEGAAGLQAVSRFLREARVTGRLEHPNIVPVYELGKRADGTLYYTMRVVRGRTLSQAVAQARSVEQRLSLVNHFSGLCQAIAYAHSRGVVHRDIKPDNVMIGEFGETVVLDWGMAKRTGNDADADGHALFPSFSATEDSRHGDLTLEGSFCGTPLYMSPEQSLGHVHEVDERSDVWSLGVVLYTILLGRTPFTGKSLPEIAHKVQHACFVPLRQADPRIPAELAAVAERALKANKAERYATAHEMARDIQAYQAGARVGAYEYSSWELLKRFVARQRAAVIASAVGIVSFCALGVAAYQHVVAERDRAVLAEQRAVENERVAKLSEQHAKHSLADALVEKAQQARLEGDTLTAELLAAHALALGERADARGIVLATSSMSRPEPRSSLVESRGCSKMAFSFASRSLACARGASLELWNTTLQQRVWGPLVTPGDVLALEMAPTHPRLALFTSEGTVQLRDSETGAPVFERRVVAPTSVAVSPDGAWLAVGSSRGSALLWNVETSSAGRSLHLGQAVSALALTRAAERIALGGELGALALFRNAGADPSKGAPARHERGVSGLEGHAGTVRSLAFAEDGRYLASAGADRTVRFWDVHTGNQPMTPIVHGDAITALSWPKDPRFLAFGGRDRSFSVRDLRGAKSGTVVRRHDEALEYVQLSPDHSEVATATRRDGFGLWSLSSFSKPFELTERGNVLALAVVPGSGQLISAGLGQNGVCLWNEASGECATRLPVRLDRVRALAVSPDAQSLALAGSGTQVVVWDLPNRIPRHVLEDHGDEARSLAFSPDGRRLASAGLDRNIRLFDPQSGALVRSIATGSALQALVFVAASRSVAVGDRDGLVSLWDVENGRSLGRLQAHEDWVLALASSPNRRHLASAGADRRVRVWDMETRERLLDLAGHEGKVLTLAYSPDGTLLASAGEDKSIRLWDARTGRELAVIFAGQSAVRALRFLASELTLVSAGDEGAIRFWRLHELFTPGAKLAADLEQRFGLTLAKSRVIRKPASVPD